MVIHYTRGIYVCKCLVIICLDGKRPEGVCRERDISRTQRLSYLPKPLMEMVGNPNTIKFIIKNKTVELEAGN